MIAFDDKWSIKIDPKEVGSTMDVYGINNNTDVTPQRRVFHELITQTVSERHVPHSSIIPYEKQLERTIGKAQAAPDYKTLEQAGDFSPLKSLRSLMMQASSVCLYMREPSK